jgi:hypothetical protein
VGEVMVDHWDEAWLQGHNQAINDCIQLIWDYAEERLAQQNEPDEIITALVIAGSRLRSLLEKR